MADSDRLSLLHADARVMSLLKHGVLSRQQSDATVAAYEAEWLTLGFGSWTVTERSNDKFVGLGGLRVDHGGVALRLAFDVAGLDRVVAITRLDNIPSQRALEKFGMR